METFETNMQKLFESKTNQAADGLSADTVDAQIILESAPYLLFYQFSLEDTYRTYFEGAMISEQVLRQESNTLLIKNVTNVLLDHNLKPLLLRVHLNSLLFSSFL